MEGMPMKGMPMEVSRARLQSLDSDHQARRP